MLKKKHEKFPSMSQIQNLIKICLFYLQQELYWTHHWQKNITIPEIKSNDKDRWANQDKFPEDELSDTSSRDYPELYLESEYGQRTDREADFETEQVRHFHNHNHHFSSDCLVSSLVVRLRQLSQSQRENQMVGTLVMLSSWNFLC